MLNTPRDYQARIIDAALKFINRQRPAGQRNNKGKIYSPTGSGKTEMFLHIIHQYMMSRLTAAQEDLRVPMRPRYMLMVHPRIALSHEQMDRTVYNLGLPNLVYSSFHSGGISHIKGQSQLGLGTTSIQRLKDYFNLNQTANHLVFTTYDSLVKLMTEADAADIEWDLIVCDEAHNLSGGTYNGLAAELKAQYILHFTATPTRTDLLPEGREASTMDNEDLFGESIAQVTPVELIRKGWLLQPALQLLDVTKEMTAAGKLDIIDALRIGYIKQHAQATKYGLDAHQMLVTTRGNSDLDEINDRILELIGELKEALNIDVTIYTVNATDAMKNGTPFKGGRSAMVDDMRAPRKPGSHEGGGNSIICHIDTLAEGIDVSTISGVLPLVNLSIRKFIQTMGRGARPLKADMVAGRRYEIGQQAADERLKRYNIVSFFTYNGRLVMSDDTVSSVPYENLVRAFALGGYGDLTEALSIGSPHLFGKRNRDPNALTTADVDIVAEVQDAEDTIRIREFTASAEGEEFTL